MEISKVIFLLFGCFALSIQDDQQIALEVRELLKKYRASDAINEALEPLEDPEDLVRLYVHEGLRLFEDRLVYQHEKEWCNTAIDQVA